MAGVVLRYRAEEMGVYPRRERIVDVSEREYAQLEAAPVDGTGEPDAADAPGSINVVSDEIEVATEEDLRRIIEEERKVLEPEIAIAELEGAPPPPVRRREAGLGRTPTITRRTGTGVRMCCGW